MNKSTQPQQEAQEAHEHRHIRCPQKFEVRADEDGTFTIYVGGTEVGGGNLMLPESDNDFTYLERIDVFPEHQNKGYGTKALTELGNIFGDYYAAADNEGAQRLYDRLGSEEKF